MTGIWAPRCSRTASGTAIAGFGGGSGTTTYGENIGVMAATKVYSTAAYWCAAAFALHAEPVPEVRRGHQHRFPAGVLGGVTTLLYGMIGMIGVRIWVENKVNFDKPLNIMVAAIVMIIGIGRFHVRVQAALQFNGIAIGTVVDSRRLPRAQGHRQGHAAPSTRTTPTSCSGFVAAVRYVTVRGSCHRARVTSRSCLLAR